MQRKELQKLIQIVGKSVSKYQLEYTLDNLWGNTITFRPETKKIDRWKDVYTQEHKRLFKKRWNQYLLDWGYETNPDW